MKNWKMSQQDSIAAVYPEDDAAETAIREVAESGLDMTHLEAGTP